MILYTLRQRSYDTGQIFDRWKIRAFGRFVHIMSLVCLAKFYFFFVQVGDLQEIV